MADEQRRDEQAGGSCASCGAELGGPGDRSFSLGDEGPALCWECGLKRGGSYDPDEDRWTVAPQVSDLGHPWAPRES